MIRLGVVQLTCLLRYLRPVRETILRDIVALEEQIRGGHDGTRIAAAQALDADMAIIDEVIRLAWVELLSKQVAEGPYSKLPEENGGKGHEGENNAV